MVCAARSAGIARSWGSLEGGVSGVKGSSLHVCNLANVAYGYAKILDEFGYPVALRCHDLQHLMSQPEWDDLELCADDFPDENNFFDNAADFGDYRRPGWFKSESILPLKLDAEPAQEARISLLRRGLSATLRASGRFGLAVARRALPIRVKTRLYPLLNYVNALYVRSTGTPDVVAQYMRFERDMARSYTRLMAAAAQHGREYAITRQMLLRFQPHAWWLRRNAVNRDALFAYVLAPIYAMLLDDRPWVAVEIGTMREIPFDGTDIGRLLALAYRRAPHVLITNPDVVKQAGRLGVTSYSFCPHPLDETQLIPVAEPSSLRRELEQQYDADFLIFAPARQNWAVKGNDRYLRAYAELLKQGTKAVLVIPGWGQEIERSKRLCRELGIGDRVAWIRPQSEKVLARYYQAADLVLDQFVLGVFGLTTPKAMACGAIVLTSYDRATHDWCFPEHPPLVACETEQEIFQAMNALASDTKRRKELASASRNWVCRYHSKRAIREVLSAAMDKASETFEARRAGHSGAIRTIVRSEPGEGALLLAGADDFRACRHTLRLLKNYSADFHVIPLNRFENAADSHHALVWTGDAAFVDPAQRDYSAVWRWSVDPAWCATLARYSGRHRDAWAVDQQDIAAWAASAEYYSSHYFGDSKRMVTIGRAAIPAMISVARPYVAIEIGTSVPQDPSQRDHRLQMFAYRTAPVLVCTDQDGYKSLRKLGLDRVRYLPLPLESALWDPATRAEGEMFRASLGACFTAFVPLAQNWQEYGNDEIIGGFAQFIEQHGGCGDRIAILMLCETGPDLDASRQLVTSLGLEKFVRWIGADSLCEHARLFRACDLVLASLNRDTGSVENLERCGACGTDVAGAFDGELLATMYGSTPPFHRAENAQDVLRVLEALHGSDGRAISVAASIAQWYAVFGSASGLRQQLERLMQAAHESGAEFEALRQKRLELRYESTSVEDYDRKYHASAVYCGMDRRLANIVAEAAGARADKPLRVLDLGCGPGSLVPYLQEIPGVRLTGVDLSPEMVRYAKAHHPDVEFHVGDAEAIPFENDAFDVVLCSGMLHHLPRLDVALQEIGRILKPGGLLVAREPNDDNFAARHGEVAFAHLCLRHHLQFVLRRRLIVQPDAHGYHHDFDMLSLATTLSEQFRVEQVYTDLRVAYFYEALSTEKEFSIVSPLEDTLANQMGLNIVITARKGNAGLTAAAQAEIDKLVPLAPVLLEHFQVFARVLRRVNEAYPVGLQPILEASREEAWETFVEYFDQQGPVSVVCSDPADLMVTLARVEATLDKYGTAAVDVLGRPRVRAIPIGTSADRGTHGFDICVAKLTGEVQAEDIVAMLANVSEYGLVVIEAAPETRVTGGPEHSRCLRETPVLRMWQRADGAVTICVSPHAYTLLDAVKSLRVSLAMENARGSFGEGEHVSALEKELGGLQRELESQRCWSHLATLERGASLWSALEQRTEENGEDTIEKAKLGSGAKA